MSTTLILIGVGCIIAAIIGGGVKMVQVELGPVASLWRQMLLAIFGIVLVVAGLIVGETAAGPTASETASGGAKAVGDTGNNTTSSTPPPADAALPGKVDVFWCETDDGGVPNEPLAQQVATALGATGRIAHIGVRELRQAINAKPDYQIHANIVRFDPGEEPAAAVIADAAAKASSKAFNPAPALPGSPSVDYLSVFVCAAN